MGNWPIQGQNLKPGLSSDVLCYVYTACLHISDHN